MSRTPAFVATRIAALMTGEYGGKWEIASVRDIGHGGREIVLEDPMEEAQYTITVHRLSTSTPIEAKVVTQRTVEPIAAKDAESYEEDDD